MNRLMHRSSVILCCMLAASCGGDDEASPGVVNRPPSITGTPPTSVMHDQQYTFQPNATDADGDALTFSIVNRPAWAQFDSSTGLLSGAPSAGDVGTYSDIVISVSDGREGASLPSFTISVVATATGAAVLSWTAPTTRTDGSPLSNLAGFGVYWGTSVGIYPNSVAISNPGVTTYVVENLTPNTYYFVLTAFDAAGLESEPTAPASKQIGP